MNKIPYGKQFISNDDIEAVISVLKSEFLTQGPAVNEFEEYFAKKIGSKAAVAVSNGTAALHLAMMALDVKPGDWVLTTPNTFVASANCVRYCGADVDFVDIDEKTFCLDLDLLEKKLNENPGKYKGVVAVSFAGYPVDGRRLREIADKHRLWIVEDACHSLGAQRLNDDNTWYRSGDCQFADLAVFSFHPVKHVTSAEGGMITAKNTELAEKLKLLRSHGIVRNPSMLEKHDGDWYYEMQNLGFNYRLPDVLCALGLSQLKRLDSNTQRRQEIADRYSRELKGVTLPVQDEKVRHAYHLYVVRTPQRKELYAFLKEQGIYCQVHYIPVHQQPYYKKLYGQLSLPIDEAYYSEALSIPMFHSMMDEEQTAVIRAINSFFYRK